MDGEYLWYFFAFTGMAKQFWTENGAISGSFKGTLDGFQTQSMVDNSIAGGAEYGIVRFDEDGIGHVSACIKNMLYAEVIIQEPDPIFIPEQDPESPESLLYESLWNSLLCVKIDQ